MWSLWPSASGEQQRHHRDTPRLGAGLTSSGLRAWLACSSNSAEPTALELIWAPAAEGAEAERELSPPLPPPPGAGVKAVADAPALQLLFPCALRPAASPNGIDLQLRLFQLQLGEPVEGGSTGGTCDTSSSSSSSSSSSGSGRRLVLRRRAVQPPRQPVQQAAPALLSVLDKAAGLLAARLLFPDAALPVVRLLAAAHCASAAIQATSLLLSPAASAARRRMQLRAAAPLAGAAARGVRQLGSVLQRYGEPAFVLLALAALWMRVHPSSAQIGECVAALIPVLAGYNQTARQCVRQGLSGDAAEELWRKQHKWAARRTAGLLQDLPRSPPLAGAVSALEALNIQVGAMLDGAHFGSLTSTGSSSSGGSSSRGGVQLWASVGLRSRRSRQEQRAALSVPPGHVAAVPAGPVEEEALEAGASSSGSGSELDAEQWDEEQPHGSLPGQPHPAARCGEEQAAGLPPALEPAAVAAGSAGSSGAAAAAGGKRGATWDSPSEAPCSPLPGMADWGAQAGFGAAGVAGAAAVGADFMHPAHWAAARQAAAAAVMAGGAGAGGAAQALSTSTSSVAGSSGSVHSFLLPGACYSSSQSSNEAGEQAAFAAGFAAGEDVLLGAAGGSAAAEPPRQAAVVLTAAALAVAEQPAAEAAVAAAAGAAVAGAEAAPAGGIAVKEEALPLYGRGDHLANAARPLTVDERLQLILRAGQLLYFFAPFLLLGCFMLLLAAQLEAAAVRRRSRQRQRQQAQHQAPAAAAAAAHAAVQATGAIVQQQAEGGDAEADGVAASPAAQRLKMAAWRLLLRACKRAGAATVKWAQWSSTREDVFPQEFCRVMSELHDRAPTHTMAESRRTVEAAFGRPLEDLFLSFEPRPLASGSIAQVHRAVMLVDGQPQEVAVKVRHPGVTLRIWQDFQLLRPLAALTGRIRTLRSLNLSDSVAQFSHTMTAQADLRVEAVHLRRFYNNFRAVGSSVRVPRPLEGLCSEAVLVESFEAGRSVADFIRAPHPQNTQIVSLGLDCFLKQLLADNFVHTDLHPGNILVRTAQHAGSGSQRGGGGSQQGSSHSGGGGAHEDTSRVELVLLDFGLAEELTPAVRHHFISFLHMISRGDGRRAAEHLLQWSVNQRCPDPEAFTAAMIELFREKCDIHSEGGINVDAVLKGVLHLARHHEVSIDSNYAALVVGVCVIVGFATSLDRRVNLMDAATPCFLYHALTGRVSGRLYM